MGAERRRRSHDGARTRDEHATVAVSAPAHQELEPHGGKWGYSRGEDVEIRSFELGVCVEPEDPNALVEPLGSDTRFGKEARARALPFDISRRVPLTDPFLGRALVARGERAEKGHLNY